jgi:hypothetical protein
MSSGHRARRKPLIGLLSSISEFPLPGVEFAFQPHAWRVIIASGWQHLLSL